MEWYPWLNKIYLQMLSSYRNKRGHHFSLIQSKKNNGLDALVYFLSCWLMCNEPNVLKNCNQCQSCRLMSSNFHPDFYSLEPDKYFKSIGVEKVRSIIEKVYRYAQISRVKIIYIKNSEWLTEEAVNALLKIFEEPPDNTYFFLGCKDYVRLLPTFLSRCLRWTLFLPKEEVSLQWLWKKGIVNNLAITALRLCSGAPLEAYFFVKSDYWKLRSEFCIKLKKSIDSGHFLNVLSFIKNHGYEDKILVSWLCSFFIDALKWSQGIYDFLINVDQKDLVCCISVQFSSLWLHHQLQQWLICLHYWESFTYVNQKLLLSYQLLNMEGHVLNFVRF